MTDAPHGHTCPACGQWVEPELTPEQIARMRMSLLAFGHFGKRTQRRSISEWRDAVKRKLSARELTG